MKNVKFAGTLCTTKFKRAVQTTLGAGAPGAEAAVHEMRTMEKSVLSSEKLLQKR